MEDIKVNEIVEDVKEEVAEQNAPVDDHDLIDVIEKLTEEVNALKARVVALEEVKEEKIGYNITRPPIQPNLGYGYGGLFCYILQLFFRFY